MEIKNIDEWIEKYNNYYLQVDAIEKMIEINF